jgi:glycosyltransferase involved in cell wall biosynthesis
VSRRPLHALVVAYDFPPHAAIGTMRTLRLVQRLAEDGWDVKVLTSDPRSYKAGTPVDEGLLARVPPSVTVVRAPAVRGFDALKNLVRRPSRKDRRNGGPAPAQHTRRGAAFREIARRVLDVVDAALAIPDHESAWLAPAVARGLWVCRNWRPDVLYSSAPPWTGQIVARALASMLRCPWVADFRDPWARAPWREARRAFVKRANNVLERAVIGRADAVLFVTHANLDEFSTFYGADARTRFHFVPNGCDPSEFEGLVRNPTSSRFVLLHAGALYGARNPVPLIQAIASAIERGALARDHFRLRLLGPISLDIDVAAECQRLGVGDVVELIPRVSRSASLQAMVSATALLLVQPVTTVSVPGKAYEYLAARRPVLALAEEGETADLVRGSGVGVSIRPDAGGDAIEAALLKVIEIASRPFLPPPPTLYDGRVHAVTAAALLTQMARSKTEDLVSPTPARGGVALEQPRR